MAINKLPIDASLTQTVDKITELETYIKSIGRGGARTITPSTSDQTLQSGVYTGNITVAGDTDLIATNILMGKNIFGINGNVTVSSLGGKRWASGTFYASVSGSNLIGSVSSIAFEPNIVIVYYSYSSSYKIGGCRIRSNSIYNNTSTDINFYGISSTSQSGSAANMSTFITSLTNNGFNFSMPTNSIFKDKDYIWVAIE